MFHKPIFAAKKQQQCVDMAGFIFAFVFSCIVGGAEMWTEADPGNFGGGNEIWN